ncbi:MAG: hypothetical protein HQL69_00870 [Magnetococcales bacterium]|nr:hypothetical protein [Magnetococcales bacterium]
MSKIKYIIAFLLVFSFGGVNESSADWGGVVSYQEDVYPIIHFRCLSCHKTGGTGEEASGLNLETYEGLMKGTKHGPVVVPRNPLVSNLNVLVEGRAAVRMPHNKKRLTPCDVEILHRWVQQGARNN